MSFRFPSEAPAGPLLDEQHVVEQAGNREDREWALLPVEDVNVARRSPARLLITASTPPPIDSNQASESARLFIAIPVDLARPSRREISSEERRSSMPWGSPR